MYDFAYHRPKSLAEAAAALKGKPEGRAMSGGMTLIPTLKQRLAKPSDVVDLNGIKELAGIKVEGSGVTIGGMTRHADVASSPEVKAAIPALAHLAGHIGDPQVRNRGTMGGSVANNDRSFLFARNDINFEADSLPIHCNSSRSFHRCGIGIDNHSQARQLDIIHVNILSPFFTFKLFAGRFCFHLRFCFKLRDFSQLQLAFSGVTQCIG